MKSARYLVGIYAAGGGPGAPLGLVWGAPPAPPLGPFCPRWPGLAIFFWLGKNRVHWLYLPGYRRSRV